jgi:hypothetical protein
MSKIVNLEYAKKQAHVIRYNVQNFIDTFGLDNIGFWTVTFEDNVTDNKEAMRRWNSFNTNFLLKTGFIGAWLLVKERQTKRGKKNNDAGAWHFHVLVDFRCNIRTKYSPKLSGFYKIIRKVAPKYKIGRCELKPIKKNAEAMSYYVAKYIIKGLHEKLPEDKGIRLYNYSRKYKWAQSTPKFQWLTENSKNWRDNVSLMARYICRSDEYFSLQQNFGKRWAFHLRENIISFKEKYLTDEIPF